MSLLELSSLGERLFAWTWRTSLEASVLIGLVFLLQRLFRKQLSARSSYLLSWLILLRLVLPDVPESDCSPWSAHQWQGKALWGVSTTMRPTPLNGDASAVDLSSLSSPSPRGASAPGHPAVTAVPRSSSWRLWLGVSWVVGALSALGFVVWPHQRFAQWVKRQGMITDPGVLALLERSKERMGVSKRVGLIAAGEGTIPMLYGWRRPVLLMPVNALAGLEERELAMVMLHELAHLKRRDILLNWVMILVQSWHWFNPLVWLALRRLRADRELVCDEMVLRVLSREERRVYGNTLVKLLEGISSAGLLPSLVPVINNKHEIKRRIVMISKFTPATRPRWILASGLVLLAGWLTFTRGADPSKPAPAIIPTLPGPAPLSTPTVPLAPLASSPPSSRPDRDKARTSELDRLQMSLDALDHRIQQKQAEVDRLRQELGGLSDTGGDGPVSSSLDVETVRMVERERISTEATAARYQSLYKEFKSKSLSEQVQAIPTAIPDTELTQLLRDLNTAETSRAKLVQEYGPDHPSVRQVAAMISSVRTQIQARVEGILAGVEAQAASHMASAVALSNRLQSAMNQDAQLAEKYRPYFLAKRDLEPLRKVRETLLLKLLTKQYDAAEADPH